uniref:Uncharacterized protein n=1 Tax=Onchocerca volvulus TaxID=6282 RepID=A0A8R1TZ85_ONCVO
MVSFCQNDCSNIEAFCIDKVIFRFNFSSDNSSDCFAVNLKTNFCRTNPNFITSTDEMLNNQAMLLVAQVYYAIQETLGISRENSIRELFKTQMKSLRSFAKYTSPLCRICFLQ